MSRMVTLADDYLSEAESAVATCWSSLRPPPDLTLSEWADQYRRLSAEDSAETGQWRTSRAPFQKGIMNAISDPRVEEVVIMKSGQVGGTQILLNAVGYHIHLDPCPILWVRETFGLVESFAKKRFEPFRRDNKIISDRIPEPKLRSPDNTTTEKSFPGGRIIFRGANTATGLKSDPIRVLILDEVDGYPISTQEGEPVELAVKRTNAWWNRKIVKCSTPTREKVSRIGPAYEGSDQRRYMVPCQSCGHEQYLVWSQVKWSKTADGEHLPETAVYVCSECKDEWSDVVRMRALSKGQWKANRPFTKIAGFHINELMSPFKTLAEIVASFLKVKDDPNRFEIWVCQTLGEVWKDRGEAPEADRLYERREAYKIGTVPAGAVILTAGVDIHPDRIEAEIVGWGKDRESWSVAYKVLHGDVNDSPVWEALDELLEAPFDHEKGGVCYIARAAVDTGDMTDTVYSWWREKRPPKVMLVKGYANVQAPVGRGRWIDIDIRGKAIKRGVHLWQIGVSHLKEELYRWLRTKAPMNGEHRPRYCHFPQYDLEHFEQLTAEELMTHTDARGVKKQVWTKTRGRNEALDCRIYARAAASNLGMDAWKESKWSQLEANLSTGNIPPRSEVIVSEHGTKTDDKRWLDNGKDRKTGWLAS